MALSARADTPAPRIALKVDVATLRGTTLGVPRLAELFAHHRAGATFLFSLGPDRAGRAIRRMLPAASQADRDVIVDREGLKAPLYGTLLPGLDIGKHCADTLRSVRDAGFETGIHAWDYVRWLDGIGAADAQWTLRQMQRAVERFESIFNAPPRVHGAPGWQTNVHSFRLTQRLGFDFCSDSRGTCPHIPVLDAEIVACPQIPTTLPTIAEVIGCEGGGVDDACERILRAAASTPAAAGHVLTVRAEIEGLKLLPVLDRVLNAWREAGIQLMSLGAYLEAASGRALPRHRTFSERTAGGHATVTVQGPEFLPRSSACA